MLQSPTSRYSVYPPQKLPPLRNISVQTTNRVSWTRCGNTATQFHCGDTSATTPPNAPKSKKRNNFYDKGAKKRHFCPAPCISTRTATPAATTPTSADPAPAKSAAKQPLTHLPTALTQQTFSTIPTNKIPASAKSIVGNMYETSNSTIPPIVRVGWNRSKAAPTPIAAMMSVMVRILVVLTRL